MKNELLNDNVDVCIDCYMAHHEGRTMADTSVDWTDNIYAENVEGDDGEPTGITDFSSSRCECCGTTLAGARFRMAIWTTEGN